MYFTAFLIVVVLSAVVSLRRSRNLSQPQWATPAQRRAARWRATWPAICAAIFGLGLIAFDHVQDKQEFGPSVTIHLMAFTAAFCSGWFLGLIGGMDWDSA